MARKASPAGGLILNDPLLLPIQGAASEPLAFPVQDIVKCLPAGGAAVACGVAGRAHGAFVAAWPVTERREKKFLLRDHAPA